VAGQFKVLTDNNPLTYILSSAKLDGIGQRWASALSQYADGMSRYPCHAMMTKTE